MPDSLKISDGTIRLMKGDITDLEVESFVYYAREDLKLGAGYGTAISVRGGPTIQAELDKVGKIDLTNAYVSSAGEMKAKYIIHANGPKFQEEQIPDKLKKTIINALKKAEEKGITQIAFPPMGSGFYCVPLDISADITLKTLKEYLLNSGKIKDIIVCLLDSREYEPYQKRFSTLGSA